MLLLADSCSFSKRLQRYPNPSPRAYLLPCASAAVQPMYLQCSLGEINFWALLCRDINGMTQKACWEVEKSCLPRTSGDISGGQE